MEEDSRLYGHQIIKIEDFDTVQGKKKIVDAINFCVLNNDRRIQELGGDLYKLSGQVSELKNKDNK